MRITEKHEKMLLSFMESNVWPEPEDWQEFEKRHPELSGDVGTILMESFVEEGFVKGAVDSEGKRVRATYEGLTWKGHKRLRQLRTPAFIWWSRENWFPLIVSASIIGSALGSIIYG